MDTEQLDHHIFQDKETGYTAPPPEREPIFKLSWSSYFDSTDPRGGKTTLAILGGLNAGEAAGLTVIQLPAFNPLDPPASTSPTAQLPLLHPSIRAAMRESLDPLESFFYFTQGVVQDYLLVPKQSPHFAGCFDPIGILLLIEGQGDTRVIEAYQYPPPEFSFALNTKGTLPISPGAKKDPLESLADDLASTLEDLQMTGEPQRLALPGTLLNGSTGLLDGQLLKLERDTHQTLIGDTIIDDLALLLKGGLAWADEAKTNDLKLAKVRCHVAAPSLLKSLMVC